MLGKYTVPLQCQVWQSYYNTDSWLLTLLCFLFPMLNKRIPVKKKQALQVSVGRMVLHSALWCSGLALGLIWRCQVGCWGWGSCRRQKQWGTRTPFPEEKGLSSSTLGLCWLGPALSASWWTPISVPKILVWGRLFFLKEVGHWVTDKGWTITNQKIKPTAHQGWNLRQRKFILWRSKNDNSKNVLSR